MTAAAMRGRGVDADSQAQQPAVVLSHRKAAGQRRSNKFVGWACVVFVGMACLPYLLYSLTMYRQLAHDAGLKNQLPSARARNVAALEAQEKVRPRCAATLPLCVCEPSPNFRAAVTASGCAASHRRRPRS